MNLLFSCYYIIVGFLYLVSCGTLKIGCLFESGYADQEAAFMHAIDNINARRDLLPHTKLEYVQHSAPRDDSFAISKRVCRQMKDGIAAVFGPMSSISASHVQSICSAMEIPHIKTHPDFSDRLEYYSLNLYPYYRTLGVAYLDAIKMWKWKSFTVLYQSNDGLLQLQELLKAPGHLDVKVTIRRLESSEEGDYRPVLKEIQKRKESHIVLDCDYDMVHRVLKQAQSINMMSQYYHYLVASLDLELIDLESYKYGGANITAFRLINHNNPDVSAITQKWHDMKKRTGYSPLGNLKGLKTETALVYDAVHLFAQALDDLNAAVVVETEAVYCNRDQTWDQGISLLNYLKMTEINGLTGKVRYDNKGLRSDFQLDLIGLTLTGMEKIGEWNPSTGLNITKNEDEVIKEVAESLKNKSLIVTSIIESPYIMMSEDPNARGNARYEGYCVDLLHEISKILHFNYTINLVKDGQYGAPSGPGGEWTGMVRELMDRKADLAVASLTISYKREQVIDFTKPFMNLGISILFKKPEKKNPSLFSFLSPLSFDIWICMLAAYLVVSFMLFVLARLSPYEWYNPHPCNQDSDIVENQFSLLNSLWFTIGSLMQQGSEVAPRAVSTRLVSGIWWFFTLIMISSYTANLAAFLTVERMTSPIENADDLSKQTEIKYGTVYGGSTMTFFESSKIPTYERMWNFMSSTKPSIFANSTPHGIQRVKDGNYAFLMESTMIEYNTQRNCDLMQVGGLLDSKGYGIGTPMGSPYRDLISNAILKLQEDQTLQMLYNRWWKQRGSASCGEGDKNAKNDANALAIDNVGGIFVVLVGGLVLSLIVVIFEFIWKTRKNAADHTWKTSVWTEMKEDFYYAVSCFNSSTRTVRKKKTNNKTVSNPDFYGDPSMPLSGPPIMPQYDPYKQKGSVYT